MRLARPTLIVSALAVAGALGAVLYGTAGPAGNGGASCRAASAAAERLAPLARGEVAAVTVSTRSKPVADLSFDGPAGEPTTLADFRGRTVLLNLWATWCAPCRHEMPALDQLQGELGGPGFEVVAVNIDTRNLDKPKAWLQENGIGRLRPYADPQGRVFQALQRSGQVVGLPTTLLIDPEGCEVAVLKGPADWASADALRLVRAALGLPG